MINPEQQFDRLKTASLFPAQRKAMLRQKLVAHMSVNTLPSSSLWSRLMEKFSTRTLSFIVVFLALLIVGAGTATAASHALPGQILYSFKLGVNEPVRSLLIFDADTKAAFEADLAAERAEEANELFVSGHLDEETQVRLSNNFDSHVSQVQSRLERLQGDNVKETQALLNQAKDKIKNHQYEQAASLGHQVSATAR